MMEEKVNEFLKTFSALIAVAKMYEAGHRQFQISVDKAYVCLQDVFKERNELLLGIVEDEIIYDDRVLFKLSEALQNLIICIKKKGIDKICFYSDIGKNDFIRFATLIVTPEEIAGDPQEHLEMMGVRGISVSRLTAPDEEQRKEEGEEISLYENTLRNLSLCFEKISEDQAQLGQVYARIRSVAMLVSGKLREECPECLGEESAGKFDFVTVHSLNTALLSVYTASKMGFTQEEMTEIAFAALMAYGGDIKGEGDLEKRPRIAAVNAKRLLKFRDVLGKTAVAVAFEQGVPYDPALANPLGIQWPEPHPVSMIVSLCALFDCKRLTAENEHDRAVARVCHMINQECQGWFHPQLLKRFITIMTG
ncbi:MAG: hypothetical protein AB1650_01460 [Candidatus Omnitrophota bacterium]